MAMTSRPCLGCGSDVLRVGSRGAIPPYCSDACKPRCSVEGCTGHVRKRGWCASHYAQQQKSGVAPRPFKYKWAPGGGACKVCGQPVPAATGRREFCSNSCQMLWSRYKGKVPATTTCIACGVVIDLTAKVVNGKRRKAHVKFCRPCKQDYSKYKLSARELAARDGTDCGICHSPVDMTLRRQDSNMCASVDHVIPRALGGSHEPQNLQLAHLFCNQVKSDGRDVSRLLGTGGGGSG